MLKSHTRWLPLLLLSCLTVVLFAPPPAFAADPPITYDDVLALVKSGEPDRVILRSIDNSPTLFTLGEDQERELRSEGASDAVIAALKGERRGAQSAEPAQNTIQTLAIVLDYSNSMNDETTDGQRKIDVAKQRVCELVRGIPDGLNVTVIVYGHRGNPRPCQAVEVIRNLARLTAQSRAQLVRDIEQRRAVGKTPIALALRTARNVLAAQNARCGLILISDGIETCDGDPVAEAAALANNLNVRFCRVVGFDVDAEGRDQLDATAAAAGGEYLSASNAEEFGQVIEDVKDEVDEAAEKPAVVRERSQISAVVVEELNVEGYPRLEAVSVYKPGEGDPNSNQYINQVAEIDQFGSPVPLAAGDYEFWYKAEGVPYWVKLTEETIGRQEKVTLTTNRLVSALSLPEPNLSGLSALEEVWVYETGEYYPANETLYRVQLGTEYGAPLLVPAGQQYDVVLKLEGADPVPVATEVPARPGSLVVIGGQESAGGGER